MSDNELIVNVPQSEQLPAEYQADWNEVVNSTEFIPRIQLYGSNSNAVKNELINQGRYGYPKSSEEIIDLGKEVDCIPLNWHFKAMQFNGDEPPLVTYDPKSNLFGQVKGIADGGGLTGSVYGIEFLLYLPVEEGEISNFVTLFLNNKSQRREAGNFRALIGKAATLKVKLAKNAKGAWHVPFITKCSTPFDKIPTDEEMFEKIELFNKEPHQNVDVASDSEVESQDVER
jgi:hypothetical protein